MTYLLASMRKEKFKNWYVFLESCILISYVANFLTK
jgi:hypothetical protein